MRKPLHPAVPRLDVAGCRVAQPRLLALGQPHLHFGRKQQRDFVLQRKQVVERAIIAVRPHVRTGCRFDQLGRDADSIPGLAHAAFKHVPDIKFASDLAHIHRATLVDKRRIARDHPQTREFRQRGDDVLDQAVGKVVLLRIAGHVRKRQYCDRRHGGLADPDRRTGYCGGLHLPPAPDAHRLVDILETDLALIDERGVDLALDLGVHEIGDDNPASWRLAFKARRHVHAVAKDVGALGDDFAQVDADPELDAPPLLGRRVAVCHSLLDHDGTGDGVHGAAKFDQRAIAHGLNDTPAVSGHRWIEDLRPDQVEVQESTRLILAHEPGVADDIGSEYRGKPARQVLVGGQRSFTMVGCSRRETSNRTVLPPIHSTKPSVR